MRIFRTFRFKLLLILGVLLIVTLGVQYFVNLRAQDENNKLREANDKALFSGFMLGATGMTSGDYMEDLVKNAPERYLSEKSRERIENLLIVDSEWQITDSLDPKFLPVYDENKEKKHVKLADITDLPPIIDGRTVVGKDFDKFPNYNVEPKETDNREAHAIPIQTSEGQYFIVVVLKKDRAETAARAARPLVYTLAIVLISTLITFLLVLRFTRPVANLSNAARRVAEGDLSVRVKDAKRSDEMGELAFQFNQMTEELEKKRELELKFQEAEKSAVVGRLASAIAHEIRNPLNYINLTLDHLRNKFKPEDEERRGTFDKLTAQLKDEVGRINAQITDFLNYSRPKKANLQPTEAREVVNESLRIVEAQAAECGIKISVVEHENVPKISADAEMLRSVFNNLFINAVQAMEAKGGSLNVKITPDDGFVKFEISDTGNGIPPENLEKIFEPYFSTKETGTGLGLAIVHKIVELHGGRIEVESNSGVGTKFTVQLLVSN